MIRVLIAEDSAVMREILEYVLNEDPTIQVVDTARNGLEAAEQTERLKPDVVVMDVHMPQMSGFEAARQIMERTPTPIVMVSASLDQDEVALTFKALEAGALTMIDKPAGLDHPDYAQSAQRLVTTVKLMAEVKVVRRWPRREPSPPPTLLSWDGSSGSWPSVPPLVARRSWSSSSQRYQRIWEFPSSSCSTSPRGLPQDLLSGSMRGRA
jgi:two-component system chemotaxis response regulator CheB